ncbi:MAG: F0F1 ATP synthase subunit A [Bacilli bacterium]|nr:F0F1 ATP synthase subunit A [Bacilli bacterium]
MNFLGIIETYKNLSPSIKSSLIITILLIIFCLIVGYKAKKQDPSKAPKGILLLVEWLVSWVNKLCYDILGDKSRKYAPMILTFVIFIFISNIAGLFGLHPPTANVAITVALGFIAAFVIHIAGIIEGGFKNWLKGFLDPSPIMLPLNIISEIVTPFSLGMRLFGNILSGVVIMNMIYGALTSITVGSFPLGGVIAPFVTPAFHAIFDVFFGAIQTYVFALLTIVFISGKIPDNE